MAKKYLEVDNNGNMTEVELSYADLTNVPATFAPETHTHDDRYYTETEIDTMIGDIETLLAAL